MTGWEVKNTLTLQKAAQENNNSEINTFLAQYPLSCVNADYSVFIILKKFHVDFWKGNRRVLDSEPDTVISPITNEYKKSEDEQWGINFSIYDGRSRMATRLNFCIPNYEYTNVECLENEEIVIESKQGNVTTNLREICSKLPKIYGYYFSEEIEQAYKSLINEQFDFDRLPKLVPTIYSTQLGVMMHDDCYEGYINIQGSLVRVSIYIYTDDSLEIEELISCMDNLLKHRFYEKVLQDMYPSMLEVKNKYWLEKGEQALTIEEFVKRIAVSSIVFDDDCIIIYCDDNNIFGGGHAIEIYADKDGNYISSSLAG